MFIKKRLRIPSKFFRFVKKVALTSAMIFVVLLSNGGYVILSALHFDTLADAVQAPQAQAAHGDGILFYGIAGDATPQVRDYFSATNSFGAAEPTVTGTQPNIVVFKPASMKQEFIGGYLNPAGNLQIMCYDGVTWTNEWSVAVGGTGTTRRFDISYEDASSDVIVLYSTNAGATNELAYRTKSGASGCGSGNWSGATNLDPVRTSGVVQWVKLAKNGTSGSNLVAAIWADANSDLSAMVWSGSAWGNEPSAALSTTLEVAAAAQDVDDFDIGYESLSGDLMIVWSNSGQGATGLLKYAACTGNSASCVWTLNGTIPTVADAGTNIDLSGDPLTDQMSMSATDNGTGDLSAGYWSGSAWTGYANLDISTEAPTAGKRLNQTAWLTNGSITRWIIVYDDASGGNLDWFLATPGSAPVQQSDTVISPNLNDIRHRYRADNNPFDSSEVMFAISDSTQSIYAKRVVMDAAGEFTWSNADGGASLGTLNAVPPEGFHFVYDRYVSNALTIGVTAGSMVSNINSGDSDQYANTALCADAGICAAFTLSVDGSAVTVGSIKVTQTGTVDATNDLSNVALFYDTDGNYSNGVTGQYDGTVANFTAGTVTFSGSLALTPGTTYYFYVRYDAKNGSNAPKGGQTVDFSIAANSDVTLSSGTADIAGGGAVLAGSTTIIPNATATTYGSGLADGGRSYESITVTGYGFGVAPGGSRANCSGAVDTGCVRFVVGGNATVADGDITAWSNTSITYAIDPGLATLGGASAVEVVAGGQSDASDLNFTIYPNVTGMAVCVDCGTNAAREYNAADTDGLMMLQGDHFGATAGTATFGGGFGSLAGTIHATAEGPCTTGGWSAAGYSGNTVCVEVSPAISNSVYTGTVTVTRNSDAKTDYIDLRVLPRIISNSPTSDIKGATVQILGDHLCESGTCPTAGNRSTVSDNILFGTTQAPDADFLALSGGAGACNGSGAAWTHTEVCVKVPAAVGAGSQPTKATSNNSYLSNEKAFTVLSSIPNDPDNLLQYQADGVTPISVGGSITAGDMVHAADIAASLAINMALQIESKPVGTSFACGAGDCADAEEGTVVGGGACTSCMVLNNAQLSHPHPDGSYHWQARVRNTTTNEYSGWVSFGGNPESEPDYIRDVTAPAITSGPDAAADTNSATITWGTSGEQSTSQVQYNTTGTFVNNCATNNDCTALDATYVFNHTVVLGNLDSNTTYYYRVRSKDAAANETIGSTLSFATGGVNQPGKTVSFHIIGSAGAISGGGSTAPTFTVGLPETSPSIKSAFVELTGISGTSGTNTVGVQVNGQAIGSYVIDAVSKTQFKILYLVDPANLTINDDPTINTLTISPSLDTYISSAKIVVTYAYTP